MARATWLLGATSLAGASLALWLYVDNRALRAALADRPAPPAAAAIPAPPVAARAVEPASPPRTAPPVAFTAAGPAPTLPAQPSETESRMDRRARRTEEFAAMFGRLDGESEADYKARILPMISAGLLVPRVKVEEQRKVAQEKAHVTPEQSARLDKAF